MAHEARDDGEVQTHASSVPFYGAILAVLMFLTVTTFGLSFMHLGPLNLALAIAIATAKAALVVLFFMHLKDEPRFNALVFLGGLLFAGVFLAYTLNDTETRGDVDPAWGARVAPATGKRSPALPENFDGMIRPTGESH